MSIAAFLQHSAQFSYGCFAWLCIAGKIRLSEGSIGIFGFAVLVFSKSVFRFLCQKTLRFWCSLRFADSLFFSIWLSVFVKTTNRFSDLVFEVVFRFFLFGFWFLFNLSGTFLPHRSLIAANPRFAPFVNSVSDRLWFW